MSFMKLSFQNNKTPMELWGIFAVTGLLVLSQVAFFIHRKGQESHSEIINIAGRQRMRSQRLVRLAFEYKKTKNPKLKKNSDEIIKKFKETNHKLLYNNDFKYLNTDEIAKKLQKQEQRINMISEDVLCVYSRCPSSLYHFKSLLIKSDDFLETMELIVNGYEAQVKKNSNNVVLVELGVVLVVIILILIFGYRLIKSLSEENEAKINEIAKKYDLMSQIERIANIGVWDLNIETEETRWSDEVYRIHQIPIGTPTHKIQGISHYAPYEQERISEYVQNCIENKEAYDDVFDFIDAQGNEKVVRAIGQPILDADENVVKLVGIFQDITEAKIKEKELEKQTRMANLNAKLASVGSLAAGVGHEINNPLAIIKGYIELVEAKMDPSYPDYQYVSEKFKRCHDSINRISKIVKGLRNLAHSTESEGEVFSFKSVVKNSISMLKEIYSREGVELTYSADEDTYIKGDQVELSQVIMNLISNAKDATEGRPERKIDLRVWRDDKNVLISVKDTGHGILEKNRSKIFDPFFTTKDLNKGVGIGLSISHNIIKKNGGEISFDTSNKGTTFNLSFPYHGQLVQDLIVKENNDVDRIQGDLKIIVVDDEDQIRSILSEMFRDTGFIVESFCEAHEALDYLNKNGPVDIIITDLNMPKMNGEEFFLEFQKDPLNKNTKFFITTGKIDPEEELSSKVINLIDGMISKPFEFLKIMEVLTKSRAPDDDQEVA